MPFRQLTHFGFALGVHVVASGGMSHALSGQQVGSDTATVRIVPTYRAIRTTSPVRVDGHLDDAAWSTAATVDRLSQIEPDNGQPSQFRTTFRILFDTRFLYVGIEAHDNAGRRGIRVQDLRRKFDFFANDLAAIVLDPLHDGRNSVSFQTNPYGAQRELQVFDGDNFNREWEGVWRTRSVISDSGWTSEIAIPWATLRYKADGQAWNMNLVRIARAANEQSAWSVFPRNLTLYRMDFSGKLEGLEPPPPRTNLQVRPFALLDASRAGRAGAQASETTPNAGGEVIWRPTTALQVDATIRTDFAQADVDRQVVNLRRFSVFFPERRQFFLENANVFETGGDGSFTIRPFFSRAIGLDAAGNPINIQGGLRSVWRDARFNAGALLIRQEGRDSTGPTLFGVARASRNFGGASRVGVLAVGQRDNGRFGQPTTTSNTVALDGFARFSPTISADWMLSATDNARTNERGVGWYGFLGRQSNSVYTGIITSLATRGYNPSAGFVSRNDVLYISPAVIGDWRPAWRPKAIRNFKPALFLDMYYGPRDGRLQEGIAQSYVDFAFNNGTLIYPYIERNFQRPTVPFLLVRGVTVAAREQDYSRVGLVARSDASARLSGTMDVSTGGFFGGSLQRANLGVRFAPNVHAAVALQYEVNQLRQVGEPRTNTTTHLLAPELRLALNPRVQFSSFYQYNSDAQRGTLNARFSWEFSPLSYFYVVLNDRRTVRSGGLGQPAGLPADQLLVKLVYLWQL